LRQETAVQTNAIPLFSLLSQRMSWLSARQSVLSENIANADTPNYAERDLKPMEFASLLPGHEGGLLVTNARHIAAPQSTGSGLEMTIRREHGPPMGNTVSLEEQMMKLSDTQLQYQTAANIYQKAVSMFRTALGGR
jgi:flagellar basal-body rod protein FlgB